MTTYAEGRIPRFARDIVPGDRLEVDGGNYGEPDRPKIIVTVTHVDHREYQPFGSALTGLTEKIVSLIGQDDNGIGWSTSLGAHCIFTLVLPEFTLIVEPGAS